MFPMEIIAIILWLTIFWYGTKTTELYSRKNKVMISIVGLLVVATHGLIIAEIVVLDSAL